MLGVEIAAALVAAYIAALFFDGVGGPWLVWWHGAGEPQQYQFYRCHLCRHLVTHRHIIVGGCACHESSKISPAKLSLVEKTRLLYLPWTVTSLKVRRESIQRLQAAEVRAAMRSAR